MRHSITSSAVIHKQMFSRIISTVLNITTNISWTRHLKEAKLILMSILNLIQKILEKFWCQNFGWSNHVDEIELFARGVVGTSCRIGQSVVNADQIHGHFQEVQRAFIESNLQTSGKKIKIILYTYTCKRLKNMKIFFSP